MKASAAFFILAILFAGVGSAAVLETSGDAFAQQCPNGKCP